VAKAKAKARPVPPAGQCRVKLPSLKSLNAKLAASRPERVKDAVANLARLTGRVKCRTCRQPVPTYYLTSSGACEDCIDAPSVETVNTLRHGRMPKAERKPHNRHKKPSR
jgi:hypothetical protein